MDVKQVIVIRRKYPDGKGGFFNIRRGKEIAQACHASIKFLTERLRQLKPISTCELGSLLEVELSVIELHWIQNKFKKICLQVDTEQELLDIHQKAIDAGLSSYLILDSGLTEFTEPTNTVIAIGPDESSKIDLITGHLKLY